MSATEIITVIKAINDHVTVKYSGLITNYLAEKKKTHIQLERELFNEMDKAVQQLINNMSRLFGATCEESESFKKIQMQCGRYNKWKKDKYDAHLLNIDQLEKNLDLYVKKAFDAKVLDQHTLFDEALSNSLNTNITSKCIIQENQLKPQYANNNNLYPTTDINLFNDNVTNSTIFSNSSPNTNDTKFVHPSSDEEKPRANSLPPNNFNDIPLYFPPLPPLKMNNQNINIPNNQNDTYNNQLKLPISFSTKKLKSSSNNKNVPHGLNGNVNMMNKTNNNVFTLDSKNFAGSSNKNQTNITSQMPPPKPPPPPKPQISTDCSVVSELSDTSNIYSVDTTIRSGKQYTCHVCGKEFRARLQWEHHQLIHKSAGKIKTKIASKTVSKSRAKKKKKRNFQKMSVDDNNLTVTSKSNKRRCRRYQCEYCDKQYIQKTSYIKHYNNHMITNSNIECNFCLNKFDDNEELKFHINEFGAGISVEDGFYQCCKCTMRFERKEELNSHIDSQHKMQTCDEERNKSVEFI